MAVRVVYSYAATSDAVLVTLLKRVDLPTWGSPDKFNRPIVVRLTGMRDEPKGIRRDRLLHLTERCTVSDSRPKLSSVQLASRTPALHHIETFAGFAALGCWLEKLSAVLGQLGLKIQDRISLRLGMQE